MSKIHLSVAEQLQHFSFSHLPMKPVNLQKVSAPFAKLAVSMVRDLPNGPGLTRALGHLRRAKDEAFTTVTGKQGDALNSAVDALMRDVDSIDSGDVDAFTTVTGKQGDSLLDAARKVHLLDDFSSNDT